MAEATAPLIDVDGIELVLLGAILGREVRGVELCQPLSDGVIANVRRALAENSILLFRAQSSLTPSSADAPANSSITW
jgi:alpha-ketoglutarate-dependent taurine dioxygenase